MKKVQFDDYKLMELQSEVEREFKTLPILLQGRLIKDVLISGAQKAIEHKLGRVPEGYWIVSQNASAVVWQDSSTATYIYLNSSATVTVNIWVF